MTSIDFKQDKVKPSNLSTKLRENPQRKMNKDKEETSRYPSIKGFQRRANLLED